MAFQSGSQIRPELGRVDYSPITQGAIAGAQGILEGGRSLGQGIASLGKSVGAGIEKYQENQKLSKAMSGDIKATSTLAEALVGLPDAPESIKAGANKALAILSDPKISMQEKSAFATRANKGFIELMGMAEMSSQITARETANRVALQEKTDELLHNKTFLDAIKLNTTPEGTVDVDGIPGVYSQLGGTNPIGLAKGIKALRDLKEEGDFVSTGYSVESGGVSYPVIQTSKGAVQVMRPSTDEKRTAFQRDLEAKVDTIGSIRKMVKDGNIDQAHDTAVALGLKDDAGFPIRREDLGRLFGQEPDKPDSEAKKEQKAPVTRKKYNPSTGQWEAS